MYQLCLSGKFWKVKISNLLGMWKVWWQNSVSFAQCCESLQDFFGVSGIHGMDPGAVGTNAGIGTIRTAVTRRTQWYQNQVWTFKFHKIAGYHICACYLHSFSWPYQRHQKSLRIFTQRHSWQIDCLVNNVFLNGVSPWRCQFHPPLSKPFCKVHKENCRIFFTITQWRPLSPKLVGAARMNAREA